MRPADLDQPPWLLCAVFDVQLDNPRFPGTGEREDMP